MKNIFHLLCLIFVLTFFSCSNDDEYVLELKNIFNLESDSSGGNKSGNLGGPTNMFISYTDGGIEIKVVNQTGNIYNGYETWDDTYTLEFDDTWGINDDKSVGIGGRIKESSKGTHDINYNIKYLYEKSELYIIFFNDYWEQWNYFQFKDNKSVLESCQKLFNLVGDPKIQIGTENEKTKLKDEETKLKESETIETDNKISKSKEENNNSSNSNNDTPTVPGIYPQSSTTQLKQNELTNMSLEELQIMRNEIFGRHGYIFKEGGEMDKYFSSQNWYKPIHKNVDSKLTEIEKSNIDLISTEENERKLTSESYKKDLNHYSKIIYSFLKSEEERNFDSIFSYFSDDMKRYYDIDSPNYSNLKNRYTYLWGFTSNPKNHVKEITEINENTFDLLTEYEYFNERKNKSFVVNSSIRFVFDSNDKIIETYNLK